MLFYRFVVRDPIERVQGQGHDGIGLEDDIDATLFAAGVIQRLVQEHPTVPETWIIEIVQGQRRVGELSFEDGCRVVLDPCRIGDHPLQTFESWR
jgi:hypothetical protein